MKVIICIFILASMLPAQTISPGTALPVKLSTDLNAKKTQAGQTILAEIAQIVPLDAGATLHAGARVSGRVLQAEPHGDGSSTLRLKFDAVMVNGRKLSITTSLRAAASPQDVQNAGLPIHGASSAETDANWTTVQVGEDDVYRGGGQVVHGVQVVGVPVAGGVLVELLPEPELGCADGSDGRRLALWVFSSTACGSYGLGQVSIARAADSTQAGEIVLEGKKNIHLPAGTGLLLITSASPASKAGEKAPN